MPKKKKRTGINIEKAYTKVNEINNLLKCNEDTIKRTEIQGIIRSSIKEGKKKEEIIEELSKNDRYKGYNMYFESWIENSMKKSIRRQNRQR